MEKFALLGLGRVGVSRLMYCRLCEALIPHSTITTTNLLITPHTLP